MTLNLSKSETETLLRDAIDAFLDCRDLKGYSERDAKTAVVQAFVQDIEKEMGDCPACGGSGGGEGPHMCTLCMGSGKVNPEW